MVVNYLLIDGQHRPFFRVVRRLTRPNVGKRLAFSS